MIRLASPRASLPHANFAQGSGGEHWLTQTGSRRFPSDRRPKATSGRAAHHIRSGTMFRSNARSRHVGPPRSVLYTCLSCNHLALSHRAYPSRSLHHLSTRCNGPVSCNFECHGHRWRGEIGGTFVPVVSREDTRGRTKRTTRVATPTIP